MTIFLLNVRSILAKLADMKQDTSLKSASVLLFCETWLITSQTSPSILKLIIKQPSHNYTHASSGIEIACTILTLPNTTQMQVVHVVLPYGG